MSVRECDVRPTWPVSAGWPLTLPTWIVLRAPAVHGVSSNSPQIENIFNTNNTVSKTRLHPQGKGGPEGAPV